MTVAGLLLAAGGGRRFGSTKQLAPLAGRPLLQHALEVATSAPSLDRVALVLGCEAEQVEAAIDPGRAEVIVCPEWEEGMAASLRSGFAALEGADWVVILLGDEPYLPPAALERIVAAVRAAVPEVSAVRATWSGGRPGHPVALRGDLASQVAALSGDSGARELLASIRTLKVDCSDLGDPADVDTPAHLEALRHPKVD